MVSVVRRGNLNDKFGIWSLGTRQTVHGNFAVEPRVREIIDLKIGVNVKHLCKDSNDELTAPQNRLI